MSTAGINSKEFNRLKGNLIELHRRVFDTTKDYPISICAEWFVLNLADLMDYDIKSRLTKQEIKMIIDYSIDMLRTKMLTDENKQLLIKNIRQLRNMYKSVEELNNVSF